VNKLKQLETCGQSPWLDYLKRSLIEKGELRTLTNAYEKSHRLPEDVPVFRETILHAAEMALQITG